MAFSLESSISFLTSMFKRNLTLPFFKFCCFFVALIVSNFFALNMEQKHNGGFSLKTHQMFSFTLRRRHLKTQQFYFLVFKKLRCQTVCRPHWNVKPVWRAFPHFSGVVQMESIAWRFFPSKLGITIVFVDRRLWKTKHARKRKNTFERGNLYGQWKMTIKKIKKPKEK